MHCELPRCLPARSHSSQQRTPHPYSHSCTGTPICTRQCTPHICSSRRACDNRFLGCFDERTDALLDAYIATSTFSISCSLPAPKAVFGRDAKRSQTEGSLAAYAKLNRNLTRVHQLGMHGSPLLSLCLARSLAHMQTMSTTEGREKLIHQGKADIVAAIKQLPPSKHVFESLLVDCISIPVVSPSTGTPVRSTGKVSPCQEHKSN